jgi:hypothetical protein
MIMNRQTEDDNDSNEDSEVETTDRWPREVNAEASVFEDSMQNFQTTESSMLGPVHPSNIFRQGERRWPKGSRKQLAVSLPVAAGLTDIFDAVVAPPNPPTNATRAVTRGACSDSEEVGSNNWGGAENGNHTQ